jgi:N-acetylmuramic acid 6-phosphate etherase
VKKTNGGSSLPDYSKRIRKDYGMKITETSSWYEDLEQMTVLEILNNINKEDGLVHLAVLKEVPPIGDLVSQLIPRIKLGGRLFYLGAGTSGRLGVLDASEIPPTYGVPDGIVVGLIAGGDKALRKAIESAEDNPDAAWDELFSLKISHKDTVVGIAASGETPYVIGGLKRARENGLLTAGITCNPGSEICRVAEIVICPVVGPEFVTGSTRMKAGTAQKMVLNMISTSLMIKLGRIKGNKMVDMQLSNRKLIERGTRMIMAELPVEQDEARRMLLLHGSVRKVIDNYQAGFFQGDDSDSGI